jgi:hypothetical protein
MTELTESNPNKRELVTEILDKPKFWSTLKVLVHFLKSKNIEQVRVKFGFVLGRDVKGKPQGSDRTIQLSDLESLMQDGLNEGTIEWGGGSDFHFYPKGTDLDFMLCNDGDLHMTTADAALLLELGHEIKASGIKVYDGGRLL